MHEKIRFQKNVPHDLDNLLGRFELDSLNAADKVRDEIKRTLDLVATFPEMYAIIDNNIRLVKTKTYPVLIQYTIVDELPVVLSIYHADLDEFKRW